MKKIAIFDPARTTTSVDMWNLLEKALILRGHEVLRDIPADADVILVDIEDINYRPQWESALRLHAPNAIIIGLVPCENVYIGLDGSIIIPHEEIAFAIEQMVMTLTQDSHAL